MENFVEIVENFCGKPVEIVEIVENFWWFVLTLFSWLQKNQKKSRLTQPNQKISTYPTPPMTQTYHKSVTNLPQKLHKNQLQSPSIILNDYPQVA